MKKIAILMSGTFLMFVLVCKLNGQNSILSSGNWLKLAVEQTGIYQITFDDLVSFGINPDEVNPKNIRIYGNGNGMLPEENDVFRYDDLQENAIFVFGEDDNSFDPGDYILFYGEAPTVWDFNDETGYFEQKVNLYSEFTYYFLNTDLGEGKRIENLTEPPEVPTHTSTTFNNYSAHQLELENLIHTGKTWYGEKFGGISTYHFDFNLPDLVLPQFMHLKSEFAAHSTLNSSMAITINGVNISTLTFASVNPLSSKFAQKKSDTVSFLMNNPDFTLGFTYDLTTDSSLAWLDYFEVNYISELNLSGSQFNFRDLSSVGTGNVTLFKVSGADASTRVWNVSDPLNISEISGTIITSKYEFKIKTDSLLEFIAFKGLEFPKPIFIGNVENQNLHAIDPPDMIIIVHPDFISEAQQLADFREAFDGVSTFITSPEKIYNEFSSGAQDITAIRDFLKFVYDKSAEQKPKYLLLFGDASYDYKNTTISELNFIPVWESPESLNRVNSYCTDDFFSDFNDLSYVGKPFIGTGRIPVKSTQEANAIVDKIIQYSSSETACGNWRNEFVSIADDEDGNLHFYDAEQLTELIDTTYGVFNISKIYLDAYVQDTLPNGNIVIPEVNEALTEKINSGVSIIDYIGHGSASSLSYEKVLTPEDLLNWDNSGHYPLMFASTCEFGHFDDPETYSLAKEALTMEGKGMSAILSTTRASYAGANSVFQKEFFSIALNNPELPLGLILQQAKYNTGNITNTGKFCLLGDPSMRLSIPLITVQTEAVNGIATTEVLDTINPGEEIIVSGFLVDSSGTNVYDFNGEMQVKIFERERSDSTLGNDPNSYLTTFLVRDSILFEVETTVINGQFAFSFDLPSVLNEDFGTIKLSYYAHEGLKDASGYFSDIVVGGFPNSIADYSDKSEFINFYPSFVTEQLNFSCGQNIKDLNIAVFDLSGQLIKSSNYSTLVEGEEGQIDVSNLHKGLYIVKAISNNNSSSFKMLKR